MQKKIKVPLGKDLVSLAVSGHSYVRLLDANGKETFRFDSPGEHVTAVVSPGRYVIDTDGKVGKVQFPSAARLRQRSEFDRTKPPSARPGTAA